MSVADDFALPGEEQTPPAGTSQPETASGLRKQLEEANAAKRAMAERVAKLEADQRKRDLTDLVKGAGLPEAAAARFPADAEVTSEKVTEWAAAEKAYAQQLAGVQPTPPTPDTPTPGATAPPVGVTPEAQAAAQRVAAAAAGASPPTEGLDGMYQRLQDRSVPWPQLQQELDAMGFRDQ
jgi:hypothetical protein